MAGLFRLAPLALVLVLACTPAAPAADQSASTDVYVLTAWGGNELDAFKAVLNPFSDQTKINVHIETQRSASQLDVAVQAGTKLPDLAGLPTVDKVQAWVDKGVLKPAETVLEGKFQDYINTAPPALTATNPNTNYQIGVVNGKHYAVYIKTQVKGLFWYDPKVYTGPAPKTWDEMLAIKPPSGTKLFCAGFESGDASGWSGSDYMDSIIMKQSGHQVYNDWIKGKIKWSSPEIKNAYQTFGQMVSESNVFGGANTVLTTNFGKAGDPLFKSPPGCLFLEQATFITKFFEDNKGIKAVDDYNFFAHPSLGVPENDGNVLGFADQFAVLNDTPAARKLIQYLITPEAQQIWVDKGGTLAANKNVTYKDPISKNAFAIVSSAKNLEVTAGDFMPSDMQHAFWKSILDFTKDQSQLESILAQLDQVQAVAYKS